MTEKLTLKSMNYKVQNIKCCHNCYFSLADVINECIEFGCDISYEKILGSTRLGVCDYWLNKRFELKHACKGTWDYIQYNSRTQTFNCVSCNFSKNLTDIIKRKNKK